MCEIKEKYLRMIGLFITLEMSPAEFERDFLRNFKKESDFPSYKIYEVLNNLFYYVDELVLDPSLRQDGDIDETVLRQVCGIAYKELSNLTATANDPLGEHGASS